MSTDQFCLLLQRKSFVLGDGHFLASSHKSMIINTALAILSFKSVIIPFFEFLQLPEMQDHLQMLQLEPPVFLMLCTMSLEVEL